MKKLFLSYTGKFSRLEMTGAFWLAKAMKATGTVHVTRNSARLGDFTLTGAHAYFGRPPVPFVAWFPLACRDEWAATAWSKFFATPKNDMAFVRKEDTKTIWRDFTSVLSAALNG